MTVAVEMMEEEETRSRTDEFKNNLQGDYSGSGQQLNYLNTSNNLFELGASSLLVEQGVRPSGLYSQPDRFIPYRPEET